MIRYSMFDDSYFNNPMYETDNHGYDQGGAYLNSSPALHFDGPTDTEDTGYSSAQLHAWWRHWLSIM